MIRGGHAIEYADASDSVRRPVPVLGGILWLTRRQLAAYRVIEAAAVDRRRLTVRAIAEAAGRGFVGERERRRSVRREELNRHRWRLGLPALPCRPYPERGVPLGMSTVTRALEIAERAGVIVRQVHRGRFGWTRILAGARSLLARARARDPEYAKDDDPAPEYAPGFLARAEQSWRGRMAELERARIPFAWNG